MHRNKEPGSSIYGSLKDQTLLLHVPKKNRTVLLIYSRRHSACIDQESGKPEIIAVYNSTKSGVDTLDPECANYSTSR
jgi:hypothetical protein